MFAITINGNDVYVGGFFTQAGGEAGTAKIARWDGTTWHALGSGLNGNVNVMVMHGDDLYVGGAFTNAGGNPDADHIVCWNGNSVDQTYGLGNASSSVPLTLTGAPLVTLAGLNAADFTVTSPPVSPVPPGGNTNFTVQFHPSAPGYRWAIVIITHDDLPENPYVFMVSGIGL